MTTVGHFCNNYAALQLRALGHRCGRGVGGAPSLSMHN